MGVRIIIGMCFGDEGKGLCTDYFSMKARERGADCCVIRYNGGAQAGHTVDSDRGRFIFHQLSSGSLNHAHTLWAGEFLPDLYKLSSELSEFYDFQGFVPKIYALPTLRLVTVDDVLINMAIESKRGDNRHGSCGMGINEGVTRSRHSEYRLNISNALSFTCAELYSHLKRIRQEYLPIRLQELGLTLAEAGEYGELLQNETLLMNWAEHALRAADKIRLTNGLPKEYGEVIFEGAQGLMLDENYTRFAPHLTSTKTGALLPMEFCREHLPNIRPEAVYVARSYVTRHGRGPLPNEASELYFEDKTNIPNPWQESLRFARHVEANQFTNDITQDTKDLELDISLMLTHLNETNGMILHQGGDTKAECWLKHGNIAPLFGRFYLSYSRFARDIKIWN